MILKVIIFFIEFSLFAQTQPAQTDASVVSQKKQSETTIQRRKNIDTSSISAQVNTMKSEVLAARTQVIILKDLLKKEGLDGTQRPLVISFNNDLGPRYMVDAVTYKLNGDIIYQFVSDDESDNAKSKPKDKLEVKVVPGPYTFEVSIVYRGNDTGVFSYLKDYRITRQSKVALDVKKINATELTVNTFESGWVLTDFKDRPQVQITRR